MADGAEAASNASAADAGGSSDGLRERIDAHDDFFCRMIDLLPADSVFPKAEPEEGTWNKKYQVAPSQKQLDKQQKKLANKKQCLRSCHELLSPFSWLCGFACSPMQPSPACAPQRAS